MSENTSENNQITTTPTGTESNATLRFIDQKMDRRKFMEHIGKTTLGALATYGTGSIIRDHVEGHNAITGALELHDRVFKEPVPESQWENLPFNENLEIRAIEERLGIRLMTLPNAYELMGLEFDVQNELEFADLIPMRWDIERAKMIEQFYDYLPDYFHEPDKDGEPLMITLTNFGDLSMVAGDFFQKSEHNFMRIDFDAFSPDQPKEALNLLTHETVHYMQDLGYSRIREQIQNVFHQDFHEFCEKTIEQLDSFQEAGLTFPYPHIRYGVQEVLNEQDPTRARTETQEFEAVLGELYLEGFDVFCDRLSMLYGDRAEDLYTYMRDTIFGGQEYSGNPIDKDRFTELEEEIVKGVSVFNDVVHHLIKPEERERALLPVLEADDPMLITLMDEEQFAVYDVKNLDTGQRIGANTQVEYREDLNPFSMTTTQTKKNNGEIIEESILFQIDKDGKRVISFPTHDLPFESLQELSERNFSLPSGLNLNWETKNYDDDGKALLGSSWYEDKYYSLYIDTSGSVHYRVMNRDTNAPEL